MNVALASSGRLSAKGDQHDEVLEIETLGGIFSHTIEFAGVIPGKKLFSRHAGHFLGNVIEEFATCLRCKRGR